MTGAVPATKLRDGTEEDDAEVTAWAKSSRPRHQNGSHMAQRCYMSKESTGETLTGAGDEERPLAPFRKQPFLHQATSSRLLREPLLLSVM